MGTGAWQMGYSYDVKRASKQGRSILPRAVSQTILQQATIVWELECEHLGLELSAKIACWLGMYAARYLVGRDPSSRPAVSQEVGSPHCARPHRGACLRWAPSYRSKMANAFLPKRAVPSTCTTMPSPSCHMVCLCASELPFCCCIRSRQTRNSECVTTSHTLTVHTPAVMRASVDPYMGPAMKLEGIIIKHGPEDPVPAVAPRTRLLGSSCLSTWVLRAVALWYMHRPEGYSMVGLLPPKYQDPSNSGSPFIAEVSATWTLKYLLPL